MAARTQIIGEVSYRVPANVKRLEGKSVKGWQVSYQRGGSRATKLFSDSVHGGIRRALREASQYVKGLALPPVDLVDRTKGVTQKKIMVDGVEHTQFTVYYPKHGRASKKMLATAETYSKVRKAAWDLRNKWIESLKESDK